MTTVNFRTLSKTDKFPFNTALEDFFEKYKPLNDVECYQLLFCPHGFGTSFDDLYQINFKSPIIVLNVIDSIINKDGSLAVEELNSFFSNFPNHKFILFSSMIGLNSLITQKNAYASTILCSTFKQRFLNINKKHIQKKWVVLNSAPREHRILTISYLLSKNYYKNGYISFNSRFRYYINFKNYEKETQRILKKGYSRFKKKDFNRLKIPPYNKNDNVKNFNVNLLPIYKNTAVEIVLGTPCFWPIPFITEKEIQSFYAKNFLIFINSKHTVKKLKSTLGLDTFDDIVNHSYDEVDNGLLRIQKALDDNTSLLDGSLNLHELWHDNRIRFEENCKRLNSLLFNREYQLLYNEEVIKKAFCYLNISYKKRYNDNS